jgi:hypothetical protein
MLLQAKFLWNYRGLLFVAYLTIIIILNIKIRSFYLFYVCVCVYDGRIIEQFSGPGNGGLITPVSLEKFPNGVRLEFTPKTDTYK